MSAFEIRSAWYVLLRSDDGRVLLRSAELDAERMCQDVAARIRGFAAVPERLERRQSTAGAHYFVLRDDAGIVIARSPMFASSEACELAMAEVTRTARAPDPPTR